MILRIVFCVILQCNENYCAGFIAMQDRENVMRMLIVVIMTEKENGSASTWLSDSTFGFTFFGFST